MPPFRVLPLLIGFAAVTLALRVAVLWTDLAPAAQARTATLDAEDFRNGVAGSVMDSLDEVFPSPAAGTPEPEETADDGEEADGQAPGTGQPYDPFDMSDQEMELLQQLAERRRVLDQRAAEIDQRWALLSAAEERVQLKIDELADLQFTIENLLIQHDEQEEAQMRSLVKIYENMKPKDAARIFEELDMVVLLDVVDRMKERKVAPVLAKMNPDRAKSITLELAQRRELPVAKN